jgi:hypothetical protein
LREHHSGGELAVTLGLFLLVQPSGGKLWRVKYRIDGKEKKLAIGIYPQVGLAEARRRRDAARELVAAGKDPGREKQREKIRSRIQAETTFDAIAAEFCAKRRRDGQKAWAVSTATRSEYLLSLLKGSIGKLPITDIEPADVLIAVRKIERKGQLESARRTLQLAGAVFRYAVATARLASDPTRDLRGALTAPTVTHYGAIIDPVRVGELLRSGFETLATLIYVNVLTEQVLDGELDFHAFGDKTTTLLLGSRNNEAMPKSINVMTVLEKCEKRYPGIMDLYAELSESAHPSYEGLCAGYSTIDHDGFETVFSTGPAIAGRGGA